jgi:hypothetical protein
MRSPVDTAWERVSGNDAGPALDACRWSFAYLPDERMKAVAAGWMARVLLGADPAEMSDEELQILAMSSLMAAPDAGVYGLRWDA